MRTIFSFVRMNPPTRGHRVLVDRVLTLARQYACSYEIVVSRTHDRSRNPLHPELKISYIRQSFPGVRFRLAEQDRPSLVQSLSGLSGLYDDVVIVAGHDRVKEYSRVVQRCSGRDFSFRAIGVVQAGSVEDRDSMSASNVRRMVAEDRYDDFLGSVLVDGSLARAMYHDLRLSLGLINTSNAYEGSAFNGKEEDQDTTTG